jgi:F-type H+-transporting ATPase subunit epsilon
MNLQVLTPTRVFLEEEVAKVTGQAENGSFCLLPRHIDFVASLVPSLLMFTPSGSGEPHYLAVDEGILVKCGDDVFVSVGRAAGGTDLSELERTVAEEFRQRDEHERNARSAIARLEAGAIRRFAELGERERG